MNRLTTKESAFWQPNKCFELFIESPYQKVESYQTFIKGNTPRCKVVNQPKIKVECKVKEDYVMNEKVIDKFSANTLQVWITEIPEDLKNQ